MALYNFHQDTFKCHGELLNKELWQQFHELDTEMIITRSGRRMFPSLRMNLSQLDPDAYYCVLLELSLQDASKHKYSSSTSTDVQGAWAAAGPADIQSQRRLYIHPDGPAPGRHWMYAVVSFGRVKLTNTMNAPNGQVVLNSMHRYQPRVIVVRLRNHAVELDMRSIQQMGLRGYELLPHDTVVFPETAFMAVTAYQNHRITKLKIDNNPFAKGFRENGQSKSKRKRLNPESYKVKQEEDDDIDVDDSHVVTRTTDDNSPSEYISSSLSVSSESSSSISSGYPSPAMDISAGPSCISCESPPVNASHATLFANYYQNQLQMSPPPLYIYYPYQQSPLQLHMQYQQHAFIAPAMPEDLSLHVPKKPRKLTDFSIKAITGLS